MTEVTTGKRQEVRREAISLDKISKTDYQKEGTLTAQIRQKVITNTFYPSKKVDSNLQANIFSNSDFGFAEQNFESVEERVAWIPVPENAKPEEVTAKLLAASKAGACIYRVLSVAPILDDNQKYAIKQGFKTEDDFANTQAVRYPENEQTIADGTANKLILDKAGNVQYRRTFFWATQQEDIDVRETVQPYQSAAIKAELAGASVMQGQTI